MYFSPKTIIVVAGLIATSNAAPAAAPIERNDVSLVSRGLFDSWYTPQTALCYKPNYGAVGRPWESNSTPGSFCGTKPRNDGQWKNIVSVI